MNIQGLFSAAYITTASAVSSVYGFSKNVLGTGYSVLASSAGKVVQVAGKLIPNVVSDIVKAHPKVFSFVAGGVAVGGVAAFVFKHFQNQKLEGKLEEIRTAIDAVVIDNKNSDAVKAEI